jgi:hypothetical protein
MELLSIVMEMPTSTQRAPKRKEPWGWGAACPGLPTCRRPSFPCGGSAGSGGQGPTLLPFYGTVEGLGKRQEPWLPIRLPIRPPNLGLRKRDGTLRFWGYEAQRKPSLIGGIPQKLLISL